MNLKKGKKVVAVSGYFNPMHIGHLEMLEKAKKLGDYLVVILNSDYQVGLKGRVPFMPEKDRKKIVEAIRYVDEVFLSIDKDRSICESLRQVKPDIFANGGDRHQGEIPEASVCQELGIKMVDGMGEKIRSSSILIQEARDFDLEEKK
ncbi:adenylyltransferase/cytidyltransferase family protein [Candidatus Parcubacteria bacterium]|nr:adenylyltransferase/cytidyltransferase family protein [Candidatus Parcubacteria bacterium]